MFDFFIILYELEKLWRLSLLSIFGVCICCSFICILFRGKEWKIFFLDELREVLFLWDFFLFGIYELLVVIVGDFIFGIGKVFLIFIICIKNF